MPSKHKKKNKHKKGGVKPDPSHEPIISESQEDTSRIAGGDEVEVKEESKFAKVSAEIEEEKILRKSPPIAEEKSSGLHESDSLSKQLEESPPETASPLSNFAPSSSTKPNRALTPSKGDSPKSDESSSGERNKEHSEEKASFKESHYESPEAKRLGYDAKEDEKSSEKKESRGYKTSSGEKLYRDSYGTPEPVEEPPEGIVKSFRSARKAIENSVDVDEKKKSRKRSDSLDEVLKEHPQIADLITGENSGSVIPSDDVVLHHNRTNSAKEMVGLATTSPSLQTMESKASPKHATAVALSDTAKALEGKISLLKKVERRPSLNVLLDSGILVMPEENSKDRSEHVQRDLSHLMEQQFLDAMSPGESKKRVSLDSPFQKTPSKSSNKSKDLVENISAPAFRSPLPSSVTHIYQYIPYKVLERRVVIGIALRILAELRKRGTINESQIGATKQKIFCGDIGVVMAVEQYASNRDLEVLVALMYDIACDGKVA